MSPHEPDQSDGDWVKRYREASDSEAPMPSPQTREAILAEGRRVAAERAADPSTHRFDPKQPAANQSHWKMAAAGTMGAALIAAVLMFPHVGAPPPPPPSAATLSAPVASSAPTRQSTVAEPNNDALESVVVTGARRSTPPLARAQAHKAQPAPSEDTPVLDRSADSALRESQVSTRNFLANGQSAGATPSPAPAAPTASSAPSVSASMAGRAMRSNLMDASLSSSVQSGDLARLGALLEEGMNPQQPDLQGRTPLLLAVMAHRDDMVELLLAHHADPNAADHAGETPLQRARHDDLVNIIGLLERAGAR